MVEIIRRRVAGCRSAADKQVLIAVIIKIGESAHRIGIQAGGDIAAVLRNAPKGAVAIIKEKVTVNFENVGKKVINCKNIELEKIYNNE